MEGGIYLLLGSNLGDRLQNLERARSEVGAIKASSSVYVTSAWGNTDQPDFYNQVIEINTSLSPELLLKKILDIEKWLGRKRIEHWGPRVIDIDMLFYKDEVVKKPDLTVPHPEIQNRMFTLVPLRELTNMVHPVLKKTVQELIEECKDTLEVKRLPLQP